jgi:putative ABC transport system substrate-binding protein
VIGVLINATNPNAETNLKDVEDAAHGIGQRVFVGAVKEDLDFESAFAAFAAQHVSAAFIMPDTAFIDGRSEIASLALRNGIPIVSGTHEVTTAGALASYGASQTDVYRQAGSYAGRILKGAKPGDLPIMQPEKFELVINLKTAKAQGIEVPPTLLARADDVIE